MEKWRNNWLKWKAFARRILLKYWKALLHHVFFVVLSLLKYFLNQFIPVSDAKKITFWLNCLSLKKMTISEKIDWFIFIVLPQCGFHSRKRCILFTYYIYVCIRPNTWIELKCINRFGLSWQEDVLVVTFFVTQEHGLLLQDSQPKPASLLSLLAVDTPYYYYICKVQTHKIQTLFIPLSPCFSVILSASLFLTLSLNCFSFWLFCHC